MKMNFSFLFLLLIQLALCQDNNTKDEVREILEFLHRGEEKIKSAEHNEIIYVVGSTGTGMKNQKIPTQTSYLTIVHIVYRKVNISPFPSRQTSFFAINLK